MTAIPSGKPVLEASDDDMKKLLACKVHVGTKKLTESMERYTYARRKDGIHIINLHTTWQKLILAARIIVAIENPADVCVISARPYGQRAVLKFSKDTNVTYIAGRFTPGTFTNQIQKRFVQPRLLIVTDPRTDHQPIKESAYVNIPVIALCDTDSPLTHVDVSIPCNNRGRHAIGMMYWMLTREVLRMRGTIPRSVPWTEKVDLFFYRDPEEVMKKEDVAEPLAIAAPVDNYTEKATFEKTLEGGTGSWGDDTPGTWDATGQWGSE
jgi:small subunit ribosomal protein SAe